MKKLLGILGTITIAGSGMAGLFGNAPVSTKSEINYLQTNDSKKLNRKKRNNESSENKKTILEKIKNSNIQEKITVIKILDENNKGGNLKSGTIYVGTDNGIYLIYPEGEIHKFDNLNFNIKDIILDENGSAYLINEQNEGYHLNLFGWGNTKINLPNNVKIILIKVLQNNSSENPWLKKGYVFLGTNNGVYSIDQNGNFVRRMYDIYGEVKNIFVDPSNNFATVILKINGNKDKGFQLNFKDWSYRSVHD